MNGPPGGFGDWENGLIGLTSLKVVIGEQTPVSGVVATHVPGEQVFGAVNVFCMVPSSSWLE
jgi:hypothetical protein